MPKRYLFVLGTFLLAMLLYVDRVLMSVAKNDVAQALQLDNKQIGWVLAAFSLGYALFQMPAGFLADRWGVRRILVGIVVFWSAFTALTALAWNYVSLICARFLFGIGEAGAYPCINRAVFSWIPLEERGMVTGINFSAGRLGAAFSLPLIASMIQLMGWQNSFYLLGGLGLLWALIWYIWFRDDPAQLAGISSTELQLIETRRQNAFSEAPIAKLTMRGIFGSSNMWFLMGQYFSSNFTFFFCLTWLFPHFQSRFDLNIVEAGFYTSIPLVFGALGNWTAGWMMDYLYRNNFPARSRRATASLGFAIAALGLVFSAGSGQVLETILFLSLATFGADMTLSPSWAACSDIGGRHSGVISGTMNMFGNLGAFVTALAFPYLYDWTGSTEPFFYIGAVLNLLGIVFWQRINLLIKFDGTPAEVDVMHQLDELRT